jgi:hypothetical protein
MQVKESKAEEISEQDLKATCKQLASLRDQIENFKLQVSQVNKEYAEYE